MYQNRPPGQLNSRWRRSRWITAVHGTSNGPGLFCFSLSRFCCSQYSVSFVTEHLRSKTSSAEKPASPWHKQATLPWTDRFSFNSAPGPCGIQGPAGDASLPLGGFVISWVVYWPRLCDLFAWDESDISLVVSSS
ncbi:hypothetical protein TESG_05649 [Trichophyton tonsurans CBS 112818]|uniref:Uncharacterized protein n=1 Tax=Trichophyton tonsurans (strain CBS 112818) TaxID=647933 RepID=F2S3X0_TRIT1|nr:hypothetical protein TESG_05649 [Trichophyton tonsurans CBS 112818]